MVNHAAASADPGLSEHARSPPLPPQVLTNMPLPAEWLAKVPKAALPCHLIGTVRATTFAELARRERLPLPTDPLRAGLTTARRRYPAMSSMDRRTRVWLSSW
jgi:hypothetical protein